jgi:hypothetical protein
MPYGSKQGQAIPSIEELIAQMGGDGGPVSMAQPDDPMMAIRTPETLPTAVDMRGGGIMDPSINFEAQKQVEAASPKERLGLFGRINQKPGGSRALLALGANLLSSPDFFSGLGQGAMAYQNVLDEEEEKLKPKTQFLGDGAFQSTYDPKTGKWTMARTPLADYTVERDGMKLKTQELIAGNRIEGQIKMNDADNQTIMDKARAEIDADRENNIRDNDTERYKINTEATNALKLAELKGGAGGGNSPTVKAISDRRQAKLDRVNVSQSVVGIDSVMKDIEDGVLDPNVFRNVASGIRGATGVFGTTDFDKARQRLESTVQRAVRSILSSNVGVQTQMDAERAQSEILSSTASGPLIKDALSRLKRYLGEAGAVYDDTIMELENSFDFGGGSGKPKARPAMTADEQFEALKKEFGVD